MSVYILRFEVFVYLQAGTYKSNLTLYSVILFSVAITTDNARCIS